MFKNSIPDSALPVTSPLLSRVATDKFLSSEAIALAQVIGEEVEFDSIRLRELVLDRVNRLMRLREEFEDAPFIVRMCMPKPSVFDNTALRNGFEDIGLNDLVSRGYLVPQNKTSTYRVLI